MTTDTKGLTITEKVLIVIFMLLCGMGALFCIKIGLEVLAL